MVLTTLVGCSSLYYVQFQIRKREVSLFCFCAKNPFFFTGT